MPKGLGPVLGEMYHSIMLVPLLFFAALAAPSQSRDTGNWHPATLFGPDANKLVEDCRHVAQSLASSGVAPSTALGAQACLSFIAGVLDGAQMEHNWTGRGGDRRLFPICFPSGVSGGQLAKIVVKYGDDHPEKLNFASAAFVMFALQQAFPCSANPK
jgi:hypothetical protein